MDEIILEMAVAEVIKNQNVQISSEGIGSIGFGKRTLCSL